jgi:streptomycin 6-kinase
MPDLTKEIAERYLTAVFGKPVTVLGMAPLGEVPKRDSIKSYGYGKPVRIDYRVADQAPRSAVFHTTSPSPFGHEHMSDRAQLALWAHGAFNRLPRHARSLDVGAFQSGGGLVSLGAVEEFCQLTEYVEGEGYNLDLERIRDAGSLTDLDVARTDALCDYLAEIHSTRGADPGLYTRRIRELVGHGECIMGLADSYPPHPVFPAGTLEEIEHLCVQWRWRLKPLTHRLRQVHGDFHPWNILFGEGTAFHVLDRSRGEWGEPADDVACITANYLFFSLQRHGRLEGPLETLFERFWQRYLDRSGDREILRVVAPFFAFRGLVMASPAWYPALAEDVRRKLLTFLLSVLAENEFDPGEVNNYCESKTAGIRGVGHRSPGLR